MEKKDVAIWDCLMQICFKTSGNDSMPPICKKSVRMQTPKIALIIFDPELPSSTGHRLIQRESKRLEPSAICSECILDHFGTKMETDFVQAEETKASPGSKCLFSFTKRCVFAAANWNILQICWFIMIHGFVLRTLSKSCGLHPRKIRMTLDMAFSVSIWLRWRSRPIVFAHCRNTQAFYHMR